MLNVVSQNDRSSGESAKIKIRSAPSQRVNADPELPTPLSNKPLLIGLAWQTRSLRRRPERQVDTSEKCELIKDLASIKELSAELVYAIANPLG